MRIFEPDAVPHTLTIEDWAAKDFEGCVLSRDPECVFRPESIRDSSLAYFCGQDDRCLEYGTEFALRKAKENVERRYPVVVVLERIRESLKVSEKLIPKLLKGIVETWDSWEGKMNKRQEETVLKDLKWLP